MSEISITQAEFEQFRALMHQAAGVDLGAQVDQTVSVDEVARRAGTIAYELLCNVKRVPLSYSGAESDSFAA